MTDTATEQRLAALEKELREVAIVAASQPMQTKAEREAATMVKALHARIKRMEERLEVHAIEGLASDAKRIRAIVTEELTKGLPNYFATSAEPLVDMVVGLEEKTSRVPALITASEERTNANAGAAALTAKNAAKATAMAAQDALLGAAHHFAFGAAGKGAK
ncbi:hypothetical protein KUW15_03935 [Qipengyuania aquimaris]|uniref:hypothetical protein n=1 Tax=Qipengyuania aquimaris TaxID=255984 RepID=UPI001C94D50B|nr:hypothetical protein [Qipengyuania aquimaris]MBY6127860.1 hypothetical protein [Qipengyuania aquimaris]